MTSMESNPTMMIFRMTSDGKLTRFSLASSEVDIEQRGELDKKLSSEYEKNFDCETRLSRLHII